MAPHSIILCAAKPESSPRMELSRIPWRNSHAKESKSFQETAGVGSCDEAGTSKYMDASGIFVPPSLLHSANCRSACRPGALALILLARDLCESECRIGLPEEPAASL